MTVQTAIIARLEQIAAVTALVDTRIYLHQLPQSGRLPAIRVQAIGTVRNMHMRGASTLQRSRVQVDSVSGRRSTTDPAAEAQAIDQAVEGPGDGTGLLGWVGTLGSPAFEITAIVSVDVREAWDPEQIEQYRVMRDFYVWWRQQ